MGVFSRTCDSTQWKRIEKQESEWLRDSKYKLEQAGRKEEEKRKEGEKKAIGLDCFRCLFHKDAEFKILKENSE